MDLSKIKKKLFAGKYNDPFGFASDMRLMFKNCWKFNLETDILYEYCTKVWLKNNYRVSHIDKVDFKEQLWLHFCYQTFFPSFLLELGNTDTF